MTKKSVEITGLPVISVTEGFELGVSKTLIVDANAGAVAAITIEDEDWYRGVKLLPYSSIIAIGNDAITVTNSDSILTLDEACDFEAMLDANIRVIGTKAITKTGTIDGEVSEIFISPNGVVEKIEIIDPQGNASEIPSDEIYVFGKEVTVIGDPGDGANRVQTVFYATKPKAKAAPEPTPEPIVEAMPEPMPEPMIEAMPEPMVEAMPEPTPEPTVEAMPEPTPEPMVEAMPEPTPEPTVEAMPEPTPEPMVEAMPEPSPEPIAEAMPEPTPEPMVEAMPEPMPEPEIEPAPAQSMESETETEPAPVTEPEPEPAPALELEIEEEPAPQPAKKPAAKSKKTPATKTKKTTTTKTKKEKTPSAEKEEAPGKAVMDRHRRFLIGKKASRDVAANNGTVIIQAGEEITEAALQKAQLAGKLIELSMNAQ